MFYKIIGDLDQIGSLHIKYRRLAMIGLLEPRITILTSLPILIDFIGDFLFRMKLKESPLWSKKSNVSNAGLLMKSKMGQNSLPKKEVSLF